MVRKRSQRSATKTSARKRQASRRQRIASGEPRSTDWECPKCSQWFAKRRNGPENHLRFCRKRPSVSAQRTGATSPSAIHISRVQQPMQENDGPESSSSDSDSSDTSDTLDCARKRHAQRVKNRDGKFVSLSYISN
jgi:hypothetical protein